MRRINRTLVFVLLTPLLVTACGGQTIRNTIDDATITARVKTALLNDTQVSATKIDVNSDNGVVTISGTVKSKAEEDRAIQVARQVGGVKDVRSALRVEG